MWGWFDWFFKTLNWLGFANKDATILFLGLDNAGKTTLLHMLRDNKVDIHEPTRHVTAEELVMGGVKFSTYDLGGHVAARRVWKDYCVKVDGIVFLVDCADKVRLKESKKELTALLSSKDLADVPFLVLGNKIDKQGALNEQQLRLHLGLQQTTGKKGKPEKGVRPIELFMCSVIKKVGFAEGFKWLSQMID
jgi:GTP-binding protein SAR1